MNHLYTTKVCMNIDLEMSHSEQIFVACIVFESSIKKMMQVGKSEDPRFFVFMYTTLRYYIKPIIFSLCNHFRFEPTCVGIFNSLQVFKSK